MTSITDLKAEISVYGVAGNFYGTHEPTGITFTRKRAGMIEIDTHHPDGMECINLYDHATGTVPTPYTKAATVRTVARWLKERDF